MPTDTPETQGCGESALDVKIQRFDLDLDIAHQLVHGDENTDVMTEGGLVPSFAKKIASLNIQQGSGKKAYQFPPCTELEIDHNLNTRIFDETIRDLNGTRIFASVYPVTDNQIKVEFTDVTEGTIFLDFYLGTS